MNEEERELFNDSLERCTQRIDFIDRFYQSFLASSDEVRKKFENTDFRRQRKMLRSSLYLLILACEGMPEGMQHLERIAELHSKGERDIPPHLYELWANCLIQTVQECDSRFDARTEKAWRSMVKIGIDYMIDHYKK
jgi:hemoglobin-like flavoprotein